MTGDGKKGEQDVYLVMLEQIADDGRETRKKVDRILDDELPQLRAAMAVQGVKCAQRERVIGRLEARVGSAEKWRRSTETNDLAVKLTTGWLGQVLKLAAALGVVVAVAWGLWSGLSG